LAHEKEPSSLPQKLLLLPALAYTLLVSLFSFSKDSTPIHSTPQENEPGNDRNRSQNIPTNPVRVIIDSLPPKPPPTDEEKTEKKKEKRWKIAKGALEVLALIGLWVYVYETKRTNDLTQQALGQAQKQTDLMREQLVGTQAAVLKVSPSFDIHGFSIGATNIRDVAATNIQVKVRMLPVTLPKGTLESAPIIHEVTAMRVQKDNAFFRQWPIPWPQPDFMEKGWPGNRGIRVEVEYSYADGFGDRISDSLCMVRVPRFNIVTKRENAWGGGPVACEGLESTIGNILARMREAAKENRSEQKKQ